VVLGLAACGDDDSNPTGATTGTVPTGCEAAVVVADPSDVTGDTRGQEALSEGMCITGAAPEARFQVTAATTGMLDLTLTPNANVDLGVYVREACADAATEIGCADSETAGGVETLRVPVTEGQTVWVIVDGFDDGIGEIQAGAFSLTVASRAIVCGDNLVEGSETCDPPDQITCAAGCQIVPEVCDDGDDNDLDDLTDCEDLAQCAAFAGCPIEATCAAAMPAQPMNNAAAPTGTGYFAGSCTGGHLSPEALYSYDPASPGVLSLTLESDTDQGLYVRAGCADPTLEIGCLDDSPGAVDEVLFVPVDGAPVTIFVDAAEPAQAGPYKLSTAFLPASEIEPNDTPATASDYAAAFVASISPAGDVDDIKVVVPGPSSTLTAAVTDFGNGDCMNFKLDSVLEVLGPDGTTSLAMNDDTGNFCSLVEATGLAAGTYYVRVTASRTTMKPVFAYRLDVQVN
jgi:hypothetical protein